MKLQKARLVTPGMNDAYAIVAVAISIFVFAYSLIFGQKAVILFYLLWLPLPLIRPDLLLGELRRTIWLGYFSVFACLSFFWSQAGGVTLRAAIQYLTLVICALIASKIVSMSALVRGMAIGVLIVMLYSVARGHSSLDTLDGTSSFVGAFDSKNQLGFYASLGILFSIGAVLLARPGNKLAWAWLGIAAISAFLLLRAHSSTSLMSLGATIIALFGIGLLFAFPSRDRQVMFGFGVFVLLLIVAFGASGAATEILGLLGKDATLTGRTYLWQQGYTVSQSAPVFGVGYQAFWVQGFALPERLWAEFFITGRSGFHFHNTYIETLVELGYVGATMLVVLVLGTLLGNLWRLLNSEGTRERLILFAVMVLLVIRSFFEIDFLNPYTVGGFLFYYSSASLFWPSPAAKLAQQEAMEPSVGGRAVAGL